LLAPDGTLQRKLLIAAALMECHPASADWLLPKERSAPGVLAGAARLGVRIGVKWLGAPVALLVPGLWRDVLGTRMPRRPGPGEGRAL
jgi:hypothetical protein